MKLLKSGGLLSVVVALACLAAVFARGVNTEIMVGSLEGTVLHKETGKLAANATVVISQSMPDDPDGEIETERRVIRTDDKGVFRAKNLPVGSYSLRATTRRAEVYDDTVVIKSAATSTVKLALERLPMSFSLSSAQRVFLPDEHVVFNVGGVSDQREIKATVYEVPMAKFQAAEDVQTVLSGIIDRRTMRPLQPDQLKLVRTINLDLTETDGEGGFQQELFVKQLPEGVYWLSTSLTEGKDTEFRGAYFAVSRIGLISKVGETKGLVQVVDLKTGQAIGGVPVQEVRGSGLATIGTTGADGLVNVSTTGSFQGMFAQQGKSTAFLTTRLYARNRSMVRSYIYSDRPVYRPGDEIQWKAIVRTGDPGSYAIPSNAQITATLEDPDGQSVSTPVMNGPSGTFNGGFTTKTDVVGWYYLSLKGTVNGKEFSDSRSFEVAAYRKPEFKISMKPTRESFTKVDVVEMEVTAENYFGGPVAGAKISGTVFASPRGYGSYYEYDSYGGEYVGDLDDTVTDDTGKAIVRFPASKLRAGNLDESSELEDLDVQFQITGNAGDDKYFDASATVPVLQGEYGVSLDTDRYVAAPGERVNALVQVETAIGEKPVAGQAVTIEYGYYEWDKRRSRFILEGTATGRTDASGKASVPIPVPDANDVQIRAKVTDRSGNVIGAATSVWVTSLRGNDRPVGTLEVKMDRRTYTSGETAKALIITDKVGGDALLTVEINNVEFQRVVKIDSRSTTVDIPVAKNYFPNATVSVVRVLDKQFQEASTELKVTETSHELKVEITADRPKVQPGETVNYTVRTTDVAGKPVASDLSFGVVDESVYAIREDQTDLAGTFYPSRSSSVSTYFSFPEVYLDGGDKDAASKMKKFGEVRKEFRDTAAFRANVRTDSAGLAKVTVKLPDNLGSWRATVVAVSDATQLGIATLNILAQKPLMVRLSLPTTATEGDEAELSALVTNNTDSPQNVELGVMAQGISLGAAGEQRVSVEAGGTKIVKWAATMGPEGEGLLTAGVRAGTLKDAVRLPVQIQTRRNINREYLSGLMPSGGEPISRKFDNNLRVVRIYAANSILDLMRPAVDDLVDFQYLCAEQSISRFVPALVVRSLTPNPDPAWSARIDDVVVRATRRLNQLIRPTGGFSWYDNGIADPGMTAIVLEGIHTARSVGVQPNIELKATLDWADKLLQTTRAQKYTERGKPKEYWDADLLHLAAAMHQIAPDMKGGDTYVSAWRKSVGRGTLAEELLAASATDSPDVAGIESTLAGTKDIGSIDQDWTADRMIGRAIRLLAKYKPESDQVQRLVGLAVSRRRGAGWLSTRDSAEIILGLAALPSVRAGDPGQVEVTVDGKSMPMTDGQLVIKDRGTKDIQVRNLGTGQAAYSLMVESFGAAGAAPPASPEGISVARSFHALDVIRMSDNAKRLVASRNSRERFRSGEVVREVFTVKTKSAMSFVQITLPRVSGLEPADDPSADYWDMWYSGIQVFDDRITLFAYDLPVGEHKFELNYRAEKPGKYVVRSGWMAPMYQPDLVTTGMESRLEIVP
ncbi:MAG: hypothetical protein JNJ45_10970 [Chthonomonas sp.]|nr:hypothetical protein [Chthonomonas sp.]